MVSVVQREWAAKNPRATFGTPITIDDVLNSRMIAYPFRLLQCCLVTNGGGALILVAAERARDFPQKPVYLLGTGESVETPMVTASVACSPPPARSSCRTSRRGKRRNPYRGGGSGRWVKSKQSDIAFEPPSRSVNAGRLKIFWQKRTRLTCEFSSCEMCPAFA
jgi:acetyl-CoA acetyltransferase